MSAWLWNRQPPATFTSSKPRSAAAYSAASSSQICSTTSGETSTSWASSRGSAGSSATITTASIARRASVFASIGAPVLDRRAASALVGVDEGQVGRLGATPQPDDVDVAEARGLADVDVALLEQLEHRQEPHDDLDALDERIGEFPERDATDPGQLVEQLRDGVDDRRLHVVHVEQVDPLYRLRRHGPQERLAEPL